MTDPRYSKLAKLLVQYSTQLKKGERILLDMIDVPDEFTVQLVRAVRAVGAVAPAPAWPWPNENPGHSKSAAARTSHSSFDSANMRPE